MITINDIFFGANDHERWMIQATASGFTPIEWERPLIRWYRNTNWRVEEETPRVIIVDYNEQLR